MNFRGFKYNSKGKLCCEHLELKEIAESYGTPLYVYSGESIEEAYNDLNHSLSSTSTEFYFLRN